MLQVRTTHLHHNHLGDLSRGPSSFSRKSLSRQSLDSNSNASDTSEPPDHHRVCATACICGGGMGAFLNSLGLLAVASLVLGAMSLLLLASLAQEHADLRGGTAAGVPSKSDAVGGIDASVDSGEGSDTRGESSHVLSRANRDASSAAAKRSPASSKATDSNDGSYSKQSEQAADFTLPVRRAETLTREKSSGVDSGPWALPSLLEAAVAMATLVLVADLCCLMVCCMQCFFAAKLLTMREGEGR